MPCLQRDLPGGSAVLAIGRPHAARSRFDDDAIWVVIGRVADPREDAQPSPPESE